MALTEREYSYLPETGEFFNRRGKKVGSYTKKYGRLVVDGKTVYLARFAVYLMTGEWPDGEVDHINGDTHDNRWQNLRVCSRRENAKNRRKYKTNKSGFKGVYSSRYKDSTYWHAKIQVDGEPVFLGSFPSPEEAHSAYCKAAVEHHKEFHSTK